MNHYTQSFSKRMKMRKGLTLVELLVVLVILVAVGGLLVPTISSSLSRSHVATCATSFPEVHNMVQRALLESSSLGTDFDSGIYTGGTDPVNNSTTTFTATEGGANGTGALTTDALTAGEVVSLAGLGITSVVDHAAAPNNVTFDIGGVQRVLATGDELITLTTGQADALFLPTADGEKYVWLGIGRDWSLLGNLAPEPPVHFGDTPGALPDQVHSRFGVVVEVFEDTVTPADSPPAEFKRISYCIDGDAFETADNHIEVYWQELNES
ncbi:prepilin-type N-terminal cleavage/methylation domain-containing protein [Rubellicoccus peritrichatus]|uniref:Prepilin-type N-terminal cleavage/methylation domain-containing protein n=1 Tax=Rubellicoccus peritrichatus TaxID=3080537 RepID=A0AAQ3LCM6_9BACT|nr:prepilin-type N-terminal cleavage/methylation domain-containing protein [Puniceicoccus sp. CR14]WOO39499.1 prepilin-type N-terminal cleavage/methylation domain-containing protein [Puniceicoccus sp. CR14]